MKLVSRGVQAGDTTIKSSSAVNCKPGQGAPCFVNRIGGKLGHFPLIEKYLKRMRCTDVMLQPTI